MKSEICAHMWLQSCCCIHSDNFDEVILALRAKCLLLILSISASVCCCKSPRGSKVALCRFETSWPGQRWWTADASLDLRPLLVSSDPLSVVISFFTLRTSAWNALLAMSPEAVCSSIWIVLFSCSLISALNLKSEVWNLKSESAEWNLKSEIWSKLAWPKMLNYRW